MRGVHGKVPVIFLSLKGVDGLTFADAYGMLRLLIRSEVSRMQALLESERISEGDKKPLERILREQDTQDDILNSLKTLSALLYRHYGQKTVLLIDEYDVPLDKAFHHGYYREMVALIRGLFGQALKTNEYLQFAVLTGCLRVAKESIFTGLNNFDVNSIVDARYDEHFGFTSKEVMQLLSDYGLEDHAAEMKEWYDGYRFGYADVYCPWDVINHAKKLLADPKARPQAFWINTSGNDLVKDFVDVADATTQDEIERLVAGEAIEKKVRLELTYPEIRKSIDNLWSVLFTTGYLTYTEQTEDGSYRLKIPNREVREVFVLQIQEWFRESMEKDGQPTKALCRALLEGNAEGAGKELNMIMGGMISVLDVKARGRAEGELLPWPVAGAAAHRIRLEDTFQRGGGAKDSATSSSSREDSWILASSSRSSTRPRFRGLSRPAQGRWSRSRRGAMTSACGKTPRGHPRLRHRL